MIHNLINDPLHENKNNIHRQKHGTDNCTADQCLFSATQIVELHFLNPNFQASSYLLQCTCWFVADLVGNSEDWFSRIAAHI